MSNAERLDDFEEAVEQKLDPVVEPVEHVLDEAAAALPEKARTLLGGEWLGHPLHPMLTDLPIGFWTSSFLLDLAGRKAARTSAVMVGLGVAAAVPTIAAGLTEWQKIEDPRDKRTAAIHMACNAAATTFYAMSFISRAKGKRASGVALGFLGATVASVGGYLGGKLAYHDDEPHPQRSVANVAPI